MRRTNLPKKTKSLTEHQNLHVLKETRPFVLDKSRRCVHHEFMSRGVSDRGGLRIATRGSTLAVAQAGIVAGQLEGRTGRRVDLLQITSTGDAKVDRPVREIGGKGVFVKELEQALLDGEADLAVHSLKDVPSRLDGRFCLAAIGWREDPRDALISSAAPRLADLPAAASVGTSSLRRKFLLKKMRPDLNIIPMRGNVDSRIRRVESRELDAIVIAAAGLVRLGLVRHVSEYFSIDELLPAPGQGMLGVEVLSDRQDMVGLVSSFVSDEQTQIGQLERRVSELLGGDCHLPIATHAQLASGTARLRVWIASTDGRLEASVDMRGVADMHLAEAAVNRLLASGGREVMDSMRTRHRLSH